MLTEKDKTLIEQGLVHIDRLKALQFGLRERANDARFEASEQSDQNGPYAASLRGKAKAYEEVSGMVAHLVSGTGMTKPKRLRRIEKEYKASGLHSHVREIAERIVNTLDIHA